MNRESFSTAGTASVDYTAEGALVIRELMNGSRRPSTSAEQSRDRAGELLGDYVLDARIASGGFGDIYRAHKKFLPQHVVALKLLRADKAKRGALEAEARRLCALEELDNVVRFLDYSVADETPFLVMRLYRRGSLDAWLKQRTRAWSELLPVLIGIARGLACIHRKGLLHLDVKPKNVLMSADERPHLADFGISELRSSTSERDETIGSSTTRAATPRYEAPEQRESPSARSDQYSFCRMIELDFVRRAEKPTPRRVRTILARGLSPRPEDRFPSMEALLAVLSPRPISRVALPLLASGLTLALIAMATLGAGWYSELRTPCSPTPEIVGVWERSRSGVREALRDARIDERAHDRILRTLDDAVVETQHSRAALCGMHPPESRRGAAFRAARDCLDIHELTFLAVVEQARALDRQSGWKAVKVVEELLEDPDSCLKQQPAGAALGVNPALTDVQGASREAAVNSLVRAAVLESFGRYEQSREEGQRALATITAERNAALRGSALHRLGRSELMLGSYDAARERLDRALELAAETRNLELAADVMNTRLRLCVLDASLSSSEVDQCVGGARYAVTLSERPRAHATFHKNYGGLLFGRRRGDKAIDEFESGLSALADGGEPHRLLRAALENNIGLVLLSEDDSAGAKIALKNALGTTRGALGDEHPQTRALRYNYALALFDSGGAVDALRELEVVLDGERGERAPDVMLLDVYASLLTVMLTTGELDRAAVVAEEFEAVARTLPAGYARWRALDELAQLHGSLGRSDRALTLIGDAIEACGDPRDLTAELLVTLADVTLVRGATQQARGLYERARVLEAERASRANNVHTRALLGLAAVAIASGRAEVALRWTAEVNALVEDASPAQQPFEARGLMLRADALEQRSRASAARAARDAARRVFPMLDALAWPRGGGERRPDDELATLLARVATLPVNKEEP